MFLKLESRIHQPFQRASGNQGWQELGQKLGGVQKAFLGIRTKIQKNEKRKKIKQIGRTKEKRGYFSDFLDFSPFFDLPDFCTMFFSTLMFGLFDFFFRFFHRTFPCADSPSAGPLLRKTAKNTLCALSGRLLVEFRWCL